MTARRTTNEGRKRFHLSRTSLEAMALVGTLVGYVLSYPAAVLLDRKVRERAELNRPPVTLDEILQSPELYAPPQRQPIELYKPVDRLIDNSPLRESLFWWAGVFGVREEFEFDWRSRLLDELKRTHESSQ